MSHTCPGCCGKDLPDAALYACRDCTAELPTAMWTHIEDTYDARDWPAHSRALADALLWMYAHRRDCKEKP